MPAESVWTESFPIRAYDVTPRGTVSPLALCDFMQEAAGNHASELGVSMEHLLEAGRAWVLGHLHLDVERYPAWHQTLSIETWPSGTDGIYATREFIVSDEGGECARATSAWLVIDTDRRRPLRPPAVLHEIDLPDRPPAVEAARTRSSPPTGDVLSDRDFRVRFHDLDLNRHVNNVRYVEWAVETLDPSWLDAHELETLTLEFRAETTVDDTVRSTVHSRDTEGASSDSSSSDFSFRHLLKHDGDGRVLALATTTWRPVDGGSRS